MSRQESVTCSYSDIEQGIAYRLRFVIQGSNPCENFPLCHNQDMTSDKNPSYTNSVQYSTNDDYQSQGCDRQTVNMLTAGRLTLLREMVSETSVPLGCGIL